jgi:hypothetical protein
MKVLLLGSTEPWDLVILGGGFGFSRSFFLVIDTSHTHKKKKKKIIRKEKKTPMQPLNASAGGRHWYKNLIACVGSYLLYSIPHPPEEQSMLPLKFFPNNDTKMLGSKDV